MTALAHRKQMPDRGRYYAAALQPANLVAPSLRGGHLRQGAFGLETWSGGGAFVARWDGDLIADSWAIRCFLYDPSTLRTVYAALAEHQKLNRCPYLELAYWEDQGIRVENTTYPVVRMRWIDAPLLKPYLDKVLPHDPTAVAHIAQRWRVMLADLTRRRIAHGDLHHDNIAVKETGELILLDYDDISIPGLEHLPTDGGGLQTYQHPAYASRPNRSLNADAFSGIVIYLALRMLAERPGLWSQLAIADTLGLIFEATDYAQPMASRMLLVAERFSTEVAMLARIVRQLCLSNDLDAFPTLEQVLDGTATIPAAAEIPLPSYLVTQLIPPSPAPPSGSTGATSSNQTRQSLPHGSPPPHANSWLTVLWITIIIALVVILGMIVGDASGGTIFAAVLISVTVLAMEWGILKTGGNP